MQKINYNGDIMKYSFDVDENGKITDINTCTEPFKGTVELNYVIAVPKKKNASSETK